MIKDIVKHSSIYSIGNVLSKIIAFVLIPIYTRYLTPSDYGRLEILSVTENILIMLCSLGVGSGFIKAFLYDSHDINQQKKAATTAYGFIAAVSFLICGSLAIFSGPMSSLLLGDEAFAFWLVMTSITGFFGANNIIPFRVYRTELKSVKYTLINLVQFLIVSISNIYFIVFLGLGVVGILYGSLIGGALVFLINFVSIRRYFVLEFCTVMLKKMLRFGLPLIPAMLALWVITSTDRYFLMHFSNSNELGLYSMGFRFAVILDIVFRGPFDTNWPSIYFPLAKQPNAQQEFSKIFTYYLLVGSFLCLGLSLFAKPVIHLMTTSAFYSAYEVITILALAILFQGVSSILGVGIGISGKTEYGTLTVGGAAILNIVLNFLLIPTLGMKGAALATMISFAFMAFAVYRISQKLFPLQYEFERIAKIVAAFCLPLFLHYWLSPDALILEIIFDVGLCMSYIGLLVCFKFFKENEITWIGKQRLTGKLRLYRVC
jgi:O-antigen/teichoic acid export membrane protein